MCSHAAPDVTFKLLTSCALFTHLWWGNTWRTGQLWALEWRSSSPPAQTGPPLSPLALPQSTGIRAGGAGAVCGRAPRTQRSWIAPGWRGRLPRCGLPAWGLSCVDLPGIHLSRGTPWGTHRWPGELSCWCGLSSPRYSPGCSWEGLSQGWCPQSCLLSPEGRHRWQLWRNFHLTILRPQLRRHWVCSVHPLY